MHIYFISQIVPYPPHGGVLQRGFNLLREIGRHHKVDLFAYIHPDAYLKNMGIENSRPELSQFCNRVEFFPIWSKRSTFIKYFAFLIATVYPKPFSVLAHRCLALDKRFKQLLKIEKPDIIHLDTIALSPFRRFWPEVPSVLTHHNIESQLMKRRAKLEPFFFNRYFVARQARLLADYELRQIPLFPLNITVSDTDARYLKKMMPQIHTSVVENGVDTNYFRPQKGEEQKAIVYAGGMKMFANRDAVLWFLKEIWQLLKKDEPNLQFFIIGPNPSIDVIDYADRDPAIKVLGFVDDIRPWVAKAAVYVVPLRVGGGTRLKVIDAMAQGKAIVSTSLGCEGIRVTNGRNILIADNPTAFARKVLLLLQNITMRGSLGTEARLLAENEYAWSHIGKKLIAGYEWVVNQKGLKGR